MKRIAKIFALFTVLTVLFAVPAFAAEQPQKPILSVDGSGTGTAAPDMATAVIGITTHASDAGKAQNDNAWTAGQIQKNIFCGQFEANFLFKNGKEHVEPSGIESG